MVTWDTGAHNETEALLRAAEEIRRRSTTADPTPAGTPRRTADPSPDLSPGSSFRGWGAGDGRLRVKEALARVIPAPAPAAPPAAPTTEKLVDVRVTEPSDDAEGERKISKLYEITAKMCTRMTEGGLKRAVRWAGREPEDMDEDEEQLMREGYTELCKKAFGSKKITPLGKVALASAAAGWGMYMGGKPIPKPKPQQPQQRPELRAVEAPPAAPREGGQG